MERNATGGCYTLQGTTTKGGSEMSNKGQPEAGKVYCLIGGSDKPSIANGNTWSESEVKKEERND